MGHTIKAVTPGSIMAGLGVEPGDILLRINHSAIKDVFDYRLLINDAHIFVVIKKANGEQWTLDIEKDEWEDLGLEFAQALMDKPKHCQNHCIFCFIDQLPPALRQTLYFKDDDPRLSFLTGNYVTLTNVSLKEARRIARYHLSPLRISVHVTDTALRKKMLRNPNAGNLLPYLRIFKKAGITMHFQIVLCKGVNDGALLDQTIQTLLRFRPNTASISVVPAGLTQFRQSLYPLEKFTADDARLIIRQLLRWQARCRKQGQTHKVYGADEFYILAGIPLPAYQRYDDFPQLENGVGMCALFKHAFMRALHKAVTQQKTTAGEPEKTMPCVGIVTGKAAENFMRKLMQVYNKYFPHMPVKVYGIENKFFGSTVTVSGLLTGQDIAAQMRAVVENAEVSVLFLPANLFRADTTIMLDDTSLSELQQLLGGKVPLVIGHTHGGKFYRQLAAYRTQQANDYTKQ